MDREEFVATLLMMGAKRHRSINNIFILPNIELRAYGEEVLIVSRGGRIRHLKASHDEAFRLLVNEEELHARLRIPRVE